jgi:hypothetical protein
MSAKPSDDIPEPPACDFPAPACLVASREFRQVAGDVRELKTTINRIETAIVGDKSIGHRGVITRLDIVERALLVIAGCIILIGGERALKLLF